jgi:hypothetical protein
MGADERAERAEDLRRAVLARPPSAWLDDQLDAVR